MIWLRKYAAFISKNYQMIIVTIVIFSLLLGIWYPSPGKWIKSYSSSLMFFMIYFMSIMVVPREFVEILKKPAGTLAGLIFNFIVMPIICLIIAKLLISNNLLSTGMILIGVVPCAGMNAVWTGLLEGDIGLAMSIGASTMFIAPFLIPYLMFLFAGAYVEINTFMMFKKLLVLLLIPLILGTLSRVLMDKFIPKKKVMANLKIFPSLSATIAIILMFAICNSAMPMIIKQYKFIPTLILAVILIFPLGFEIAYLITKRLFDYEPAIAITYSSGMKNLPIAMGIALSSFPKLVGLPIALSFIFQMLTASTFYKIIQKKRSQQS